MDVPCGGRNALARVPLVTPSSALAPGAGPPSSGAHRPSLSLAPVQSIKAAARLSLRALAFKVPQAAVALSLAGERSLTLAVAGANPKAQKTIRKPAMPLSKRGGKKAAAGSPSGRPDRSAESAGGVGVVGDVGTEDGVGGGDGVGTVDGVGRGDGDMDDPPPRLLPESAAYLGGFAQYLEEVPL